MGSERATRWQAARKERGLCSICGKRPLSKTSRWRCRTCQDKKTARQKAQREAGQDRPPIGARKD